jgi:hypothetical protein
MASTSWRPRASILAPARAVSRRQAESLPAGPSPAAAQRPCWDRPVSYPLWRAQRPVQARVPVQQAVDRPAFVPPAAPPLARRFAGQASLTAMEAVRW